MKTLSIEFKNTLSIEYKKPHETLSIELKHTLNRTHKKHCQLKINYTLHIHSAAYSNREGGVVKDGDFQVFAQDILIFEGNAAEVVEHLTVATIL